MAVKSKLILSLIKADMKNYKLIEGLNDAGALMENFYSDLDLVVMSLMEIRENHMEEMYKVYDMHFNHLKKISVEEFCQNLPDIAMRLYRDLLTKKRVLSR